MNWDSLLEGMFRATGGVVASHKGATTYGHLDFSSMEDANGFLVKATGTTATFTCQTGKLPEIKENDATNPVLIEGINYKILKIWIEDDGKQTKLHLQKLS